MDTSTCNTIVLVLLWLYLCCQALGSLVAVISQYGTNEVLPTTTTLSTVLLGLCLWQCKKAGYLVQPMTWYHWALLVLLLILQVIAVVLEQLGLQGGESYIPTWKYPIYGVAVLLLGVLGGTLFCGWKCNLFCRPCCKSQYLCYGSAVVVVLVILTVLAVTAALTRFHGGGSGYGHDGKTEQAIIQYLAKILVSCIQCYSVALLWITTLRLPYTAPRSGGIISIGTGGRLYIGSSCTGQYSGSGE
uniref:Membrane protein n=1 Tax=Babesia bovis TaxID=5865 RepID=S6C9M0_BABBO|nr:membrane protein [Babesia bovis]